MIHIAHRIEEYCDGGRDGEAQCADSEERFSEDGLTREVERCEKCPIRAFEHTMTFSKSGRDVQRAFDLSNALEWGLQVPVEQLTSREWRLLKIIRSDRNRRQAELEQRRK